MQPSLTARTACSTQPPTSHRTFSERTPQRLVLPGLLGAVALACSLVVAPPADAASSLERSAVAKINATRRAHGLRPLVVRSDLRKAARSHSAAMAWRNALYHSNLSRIRNARATAENVGYGSTVYGVHRMLLGSRPHRVNLLNPRMRQVGVAVTKVDGQLWVTQIFRQPR